MNPLKERIEDYDALVSIAEESDYRMWNKNEGWERLRATRGPTGNCTGCHGVTTRVRRPLFTGSEKGDSFSPFSRLLISSRVLAQFRLISWDERSSLVEFSKSGPFPWHMSSLNSQVEVTLKPPVPTL